MIYDFNILIIKGDVVMPFIVTEPQRIQGTYLGYSVYPYSYSFDDHINAKGVSAKLMIFQLKRSQFIEIDHILHEESYKHGEVGPNFVDRRLKDFVSGHPEYVFSPQSVNNFFARTDANMASRAKNE